MLSDYHFPFHIPITNGTETGLLVKLHIWVKTEYVATRPSSDK